MWRDSFRRRAMHASGYTQALLACTTYSNVSRANVRHNNNNKNNNRALVVRQLQYIQNITK